MTDYPLQQRQRNENIYIWKNKQNATEYDSHPKRNENTVGEPI